MIHKYLCDNGQYICVDHMPKFSHTNLHMLVSPLCMVTREKT